MQRKRANRDTSRLLKQLFMSCNISMDHALYFKHRGPQQWGCLKSLQNKHAAS